MEVPLRYQVLLESLRVISNQKHLNIWKKILACKKNTSLGLFWHLLLSNIPVFGHISVYWVRADGLKSCLICSTPYLLTIPVEVKLLPGWGTGLEPSLVSLCQGSVWLCHHASSVSACQGVIYEVTGLPRTCQMSQMSW